MKFKHWHTRITAELAEAEPKAQRLSFEPRPMSLATQQLLARIEAQRKQRRAA